MLTILVEIMMSVFIANFKASEHPIINVVVRGVVIMIACFFIGMSYSIRAGEKVPFGFLLMLSFFAGFVGSILILFVEIFCAYVWRKK
ncbi:hypothetical protein [Acinetobacter proteolyticus]|uniref:hypothetical protein n=1 Tax=Acinetobacter proteolyticus TaxID=1776741 RepID=UPI003D99E614